MPEPINACTFTIDESFITLTEPPSKDTPGVAKMLAKAPTATVLNSIMGNVASMMPTDLGILPRGTRYISPDRTTYAIEYPGDFYSLMLPAMEGVSAKDRLVKVPVPKHFICVKFDNGFNQIVGAALALSYGYNYALEDDVQTFFTMSEFELGLVPTPTLSIAYNSVGGFLAEIHEKVFSHAIGIMDAEKMETAVGSRSLPQQYTEEVAAKEDFVTWWRNQGELVMDWTFENPYTGTLADIMYVNEMDEVDGDALPDFGTLTYPQVISLLSKQVIKHDVLPAELERAQAKRKFMEGYDEWRKEFKGRTEMPLNADTPTWFDDLVGANG